MSYAANLQVEIFLKSIFFFTSMAIPILRQQKNWVGGSRKWPFLLMFSSEVMLIRMVGGVQKGQKYADVIQGWPLTREVEIVIILGRSPRYIVTTEQISAVLTTFVCKSHSFGHSYSSRNILTTFVCKSHSFGHSYSSRNILTTFVCKSHSFGHSYSSRNILTRFVLYIQKPYFW